MHEPDQETAKNTDPELQNEGEGSRTAARRYDAAVEQTVKSGRVEELAKKAERALDTDEAEELKDAEQKGKNDVHK